MKGGSNLKHWQIGLVMMILCGMALTLPTTTGAKAELSRPLHVVTYNIQHGANHHGQLDLETIAKNLEYSGADVITLQEVDRHWSERSLFVDEAAWLGERLGMQVRFAPIYSLDPLHEGEPRREFGLAILSRYPIVSFENHELSRISSQEPDKGVQKLPGFPEAVINVRGVKVHVFSTHLSWLNPDVRMLETEEMLEIIHRREGPIILTGDMNAEPGSPEMKRLSGEMTDAFSVRGEGNGWTYPVPEPVKRIDDVFVSPDVRVETCEVLPVEGSDHYPVSARLFVEKK
jgi:endonuclease/exonuclease/phosphatase family metal-dependent hydrolase